MSFKMSACAYMNTNEVVFAYFSVSGDRPIHVSYDIDSLDPKETPSTGTPGNCLTV